jgi:hypothetical protein
MHTITDVKQSRLQKDGASDVIRYDVSVKLSDTGGGLYAPLTIKQSHLSGSGQPTAMLTANHESDGKCTQVSGWQGHFTRSEGRSKGC